MKAYCIVYMSAGESEALDQYRQQVSPTITAYGGKFIVRGGRFTTLEGEMPFERVVILEFPSRERAEAWYQSPEYQRILPLRLNSLQSQFVMVDGMEP